MSDSWHYERELEQWRKTVNVALKERGFKKKQRKALLEKVWRESQGEGSIESMSKRLWEIANAVGPSYPL